MTQIVNIYTDGACSGNQNVANIGGWGAVLEYKGTVKELCGGEKNTTNNRMELMALIEALKVLKKDGLRINVYSDSSYLINCFKNRWYVSWEKNGWRNSKKLPVENQDLWMQLLELCRKHTVEFFLVKGHVDADIDQDKLIPVYSRYIKHNGDIPFERFVEIIRMNNRCDALANVFISENR